MNINIGTATILADRQQRPLQITHALFLLTQSIDGQYVALLLQWRTCNFCMHIRQPLTAGRETALAINFAFPSIQLLLVASLHNGSIQLWNYCMGVLVDSFEEDKGTFA
jgi:hypothetical protein